MTTQKPPIIVYLGQPGAGKTTQISLLAARTGFTHLSTGSVFREHMEKRTPLGKRIYDSMNRGELVSDNTVTAIVLQKLREPVTGWILDGYPRSVPQAQSLDSQHQPPDTVVHLSVSFGTSMSRLLNRGRPDDTMETIRNRLNIYRNITDPVLLHYGHMVTQIDGTGTPEKVFANTLQKLPTL